MWLLFTGFLAAAYALQVPKGYNQENLILGLIYAFYTLKMIFNYVPFSWITTPCWKVWDTVAAPFYKLSKRVRSMMYGAFVAAVIIITVFSIPETDSTRLQRFIALVGLVVFLLLLVVSSTVMYHHLGSLTCLLNNIVELARYQLDNSMQLNAPPVSTSIVCVSIISRSRYISMGI